MGKPTGFLEWQRRLPPKRDKTQRIMDWQELVLPQSEEQMRHQAGRCMDCGVPFCNQGCPLGNQIPDWNDFVFRGRWESAYRHLTATNNFPEFTGRLCPAPCEAACVLSINQDPVTIEQTELEIVERAFKEGWVRPRPPRARTGRHVAVVGSGPAGLAAAAQLNRVGHKVTVFERDDRLGGLLRYGIPDFKMEKWVIDRRLEVLAAEGVEFATGVAVGTELSWRELRVRYDAVLVATGARVARDLDVPGRDLQGVVFAMDYLEQQNRRVAGETADGLVATGKHVVVLGGGDTGSDCVGTAHRQGAASVTQIELMPAPPVDRSADNPWPQWPMVFRTSTSQEEGGERVFAMMTQRLEGVDGKITRLVGTRVAVHAATGRLVEVPGEPVVMDADLLILAMGFTGPETTTIAEQLGVALDGRGNLKTDAAFETSVPGVYAAGDAKRGASLIVWAIADGREAARAIDTRLRAAASPLPTRGADLPFGGR